MAEVQREMAGKLGRSSLAVGVHETSNVFNVQVTVNKYQ